jgi:hypothetical protein
MATAREGAVAAAAPSSLQISNQHARAGGYYLGNGHELIHRHLERITLAADDSAVWQLTVDFELPSDPAARCGVHDGEYLYLFPLAFLKKAEGRTGFGARDETGAAIPLLTRSTCDWVSANAAANAAGRIERELRREAKGRRACRMLPHDDLAYALRCVASLGPFDSAVVLNELLDGLDDEMAEAWRGERGLEQDLKMLVEHWMLWVPLRGLPGERRQVSIAQDVELLPRPFFRWQIGTDSEPSDAEGEDVLRTFEGDYRRIGRRVDFSVLGERLALPFAWMPIDFDFPTIYTRRCSSYWFELVCPTGLSPRGIKIAHRPGLADEESGDLKANETMGRRAGRAYLSKSRGVGDLMVRATVGIGQGAFPSLWLLMGSITAFMLWYVVAVHPTDLIEEASGSKAQIAAAILLIVPAALLGAIAVVEGSIARLISGARLLLLATGLAAVFAARVFIGGEPLHLSELTQWTLCAAAATFATVPLATSWLLSLPLVGRQLAQLNSVDKQYVAFRATVLVTVALTALLPLAGDLKVARAILALALLLISVPLCLLATDRLQTPIVDTRNFLSFGTIFAAIVCVSISCVELHTALVDDASTPKSLEIFAMVLLFISVWLGRALRAITHRFHEKPGEVHLPPAEAEALLLGKRVRELLRLQDRARGTDYGPGSGTEGNMSWGVRSTVRLPRYHRGELDKARHQWPRENPDTPRGELEEEAREELPTRMERLRLFPRAR